MSLAPTTDATVVLLDQAEAQRLTAEIKSYAGVLWQKLKLAHDGQAWRALGYPSFVAYCETEFDMRKSQAYRLLHHADTLAELAEAAGLDSPMGENLSERTTRNLDVPAAAAAVADRVADLPDDATDAGPHPTEHEWAMGGLWDRMLTRRVDLEAS